MRILLLILFAGSILMAQTVDRTKPPRTPPLPSFKLPPVFETKLPNGLEIVLVEDRRFPLVTVRLSFQAGTKYDPEDLPGLSQSVGSLLNEGTRKRTSRQIAEELASIGGTLLAQSGPDALTLSGNALSENAAVLFEILADVARNAEFPPAEVKLHQQNRKQMLLEQYSDPSYVADEQAHKEVFGAHPYGHIGPTMASLDKLDRAALIKFRDTYLAPNNATLILLGRLPERERTLELVRAQFGPWPQRQVPMPPAAASPEARKSIVLVDRPGSVQADIRVTARAATRRDPDYFPLLLANTILGGGTSSRMFLNIREQKGFAYDAHSELDARRDAALFAAVTQVRNEVLDPALSAVFGEMNRLAKDQVPAAELEDVKNYLSGHFVLSLESQNGLANLLNMVKVNGLSNSYLEQYTARVRAVNADQVRAAALKYMIPDRAGVIVVGDPAQIGKSLQKLGEFRTVKANP